GGKDEGDRFAVGVIGPARDLLLLSAALPDEFQRVAVAREPLHASLRAEVELRIAEEGGERAIRGRLEEEIEGGRVPARLAAAPRRHERAAGVGAESLLRFPESRQIIRGGGGGEQQGEQERGEADVLHSGKCSAPAPAVLGAVKPICFL